MQITLQLNGFFLKRIVMKTNLPEGYGHENLVMFPAAKNFKIDLGNKDPMDDLLFEFAHLKDEDLPEYLDDRFEDEIVWSEDHAFDSLEAFMNRKHLNPVVHPDDKLIGYINEKIDAINEAKSRIKFYLDEIEMFMPRRRP